MHRKTFLAFKTNLKIFNEERYINIIYYSTPNLTTKFLHLNLSNNHIYNSIRVCRKYTNTRTRKGERIIVQ